MDKQRSTRDTRHNLSKYKPLIKECEDLVVVLLTTQLGEMFEQMIPTLLDFSDKAETNDKQRLFYDAIPVVKQLRDSVEYRFREEITNGFRDFTQGHTITYPEKSVNLDSIGELSIINNQDLEEHLASERIISKAQNQWYQELYALGKRMGLVRGGLELSVDDIPGGPAHVMYAFQMAVKELGFDMTLLLIIYALFDKFVMRESGTLYESYNAKLIDAGIFPNLKLNIAKKPNTLHGSAIDPNTGNDQEFDPMTHPIPTDPKALGNRSGAAFNPYSGSYDLSGKPPGTMSAERAGSIAIGEEIFQSIRSIMAERRLHDPSFRNHPEINPSVTGVVMTEKPQIVAAINDIQPVSGSAYIPGFEDSEVEPDNIEIDHALLENIRNTLVTERDKLYTDIDKNTIPTADLDTIELVGMLFEHVLNDEDIPNIVKALVSHLHTPFLKIAIIDQTFLVDGEHTARKLLNQMVAAGKQWVDEDNLRLGLYYPMKEIVNEILSDFVDDLSIIDGLRTRLAQQIDDLNQKAKIVEERTKEAAKGRERLESARSRAHKIVNSKISDREIHPIVKRFLNSAWLDKMILMMLRNPDIEQTEEWEEVLGVVDTIIWVCDSKDRQDQQAEFKQKLPQLKTAIETGLSSLGDYHQPDSLALFKLLDSFEKGLPPEAVEVNQEDMVKSRFGTVKPVEDTTQLNSKEQKIAERLKSIEFGTWFQLLDKEQNSRQLKLSWFSPVTKKYMFVDRSGVQAVVISANELARQISNRTAKVIDDTRTPFVDSALNTIRSMLSKTFGVQQPST
ncbi:MAG: hypothetical protein C0631_13890 [Sedimenticola sp.]|nr:MAG: hypothetical protein C0631_13890 [Sedimenticola sp.]